MAQSRHFIGMPKGHLPVRSYLAVPVVSRSGEVLGGLFFGHSQPGVFTERAERSSTGIAAQAAVAIDNARLYQNSQHEIAARKRAEAGAADAERDARRARRASARSNCRELRPNWRRPSAASGLLVEAVTDYAIFMLDPAGNVVNWNPGAERIKGYTREEIIGQHFSRFYTEEDRQQRGSASRRIANGGADRQVRSAKAGACARTAAGSGPTS